MKKIQYYLLIILCVLFSYQSYSQTVSGSGTVNYVPKFSATSSIANSQILDNGTKIFINGATDDGFSNLLLKGSANFNLNANFNPSGNILGHYFQNTIGGTFSNQTNQYLNENIGSAFCLNATGTTLLTTYPGINAIGSTIYKINTGTVNGFVSSFRNNYIVSNSGSISDIASFYGGFPLQQYGGPAFTGTITNFYGMYLSDVTTNSDVQSRITNKWGIYQLGAQDKNYLNGNTLIGTNVDAGYKLNVNGTANISNSVLAGSIGVNGTPGAYQFQVNGTSNFLNNVNGTSAYFTGSMGIGTTSPGPYKLAVEGTLGARKVKVTQVNPWADYVFDETYQLPSLSEVESYIKKHRHLPEVPSAKEVSENGIDVGETSTILLKKIEELTLYIIEIKKENDKLRKEMLEGNEKLKRHIQDIKLNK